MSGPDELSAFDRQPPFSPEAEVSVLGAMLIEPDAISESRTILKDSDFYREAHRRLFRVFCALQDRGDVADVVTVLETLKDTGELEAAGGAPYLAELLDAVPTASNVEYHAKIVRDKSRLRALLEASSKTIRDIYDLNGRPAAEVMTAAEGRILDVLRDDGGGDGLLPIKEALWGTFEEIERDQAAKKEVIGFPTGFKDLDRMTRGLHRGDLSVLAARPSHGKSAWAWEAAVETALSGVPTAIFSLEMTNAQLIRRGLASEGRVCLQTIGAGGLKSEDYQRLAAAAGHLNTAPLWLDDRPRGTLADIRAKVRRLDAKEDVGLVVVDYLQLMESEGENRTQQVGAISRGLKQMAREFDVHILALSQLSRAVESRNPPRPRLSDLRDSGAIEQDADNVFFLWRPEMYFDDKTKEEERSKYENLGELVVAKQRNGPVGRMWLYFHKEYTRFDDITKPGG